MISFNGDGEALFGKKLKHAFRHTTNTTNCWGSKSETGCIYWQIHANWNPTNLVGFLIFSWF
jgi:hypothetical protein